MFLKLKKNISGIYIGFIVLLCLSVFMYGIHRIYGFVIFPDEFGYWAPAAQMLGYDWSEITSLGSYYSFGYSFVLTPILWFVNDMIAAYRVAICINVCLTCVAFGIMCQILRKLFPYEKNTIRILTGGIAVFYPAWIFYMQMTMTETLLMFLFILICRLMLSMFEKPKVITVVSLAIMLVYIYIVHMRSIGIVLAALITLLVYAYSQPANRSKVYLFCVVLGVVAAMGICFQNLTSSNLYNGVNVEILNANSYGGQWDKVKALFSWSGIGIFLTGCIGKLLYLGLSTFGLFYWGVLYAAEKAVHAVLKNRKSLNGEIASFFWIFVLMVGIAQITISTIYTFGTDRIDLLIHGRYNELIVPLFIALGVLRLLRARRKWFVSGIMIVWWGIAVLLLGSVIRKNGMNNVHGYFMVGMSYVLNENNFVAINFLWKAWLLASVLTVCLLILCEIGKKKICFEWFLGILLALQIGCGIQASDHYIYKSNGYGYGDIQLVNKIKNLSVTTESNIVHLYEGGMQYIELVQFGLKDVKIEVLKEKEIESYLRESSGEDFVVVDTESVYRKKLDLIYDMIWESGHLCLYYNL